MDKDLELTAHLLCYLYDHHFFESKADMARTLDISKRQLQRLMNAAEIHKGGSVVLGNVLCYFGRHNIDFDSILLEYLDLSPRPNGRPAANDAVFDEEKAYRRFYMPEPLSLTGEGKAAFMYCLTFMQLLSRYICPGCVQWCNPWDGKNHLRQENCFVMHVARALLHMVVTEYSLKDECHDYS